MFEGWNQREIDDWQARKARLDAANACRDAGGIAEHQAAAAGVSYPTVYRDREAWSRAQASGNPRDFLPGKTTGRRPVCDWPAEDVQTIRGIYLNTNRGEDLGSMSMAVRIAKHRKMLSPVTAAALDRPYASKHHIPKSLRRELQIAPSVIRHARHPRNAALSGPYVPGTTRLTLDLSRRLYYGERPSFDDGSQNQIVCVPWPWGGSKEADRFGIRTMRGQWLVAHDDATSAILAWTFTMRPRDSYRDADAMGLVYRMCRDVVKPNEVVCEGGVWQSKRALSFYRTAGIRVIDAKGRPRLKLIENWWNRAWTFLSHYPDGQIGRFRGEMQRENDILMKCRAGTVDGREHFVMLPDLLREFDDCIRFLDTDPIESDTYERWTPAERRAIDQADHPRGTLTMDLSAYAAPESHIVTVQRGGMVQCRTHCPLGMPYQYEFSGDALTPLEGSKVRVLYDPFEPIIKAAVIAEQEVKDCKPGDLICSLVCINPPPLPIASEGWQVAKDPYGLLAGMDAKRAIGQAVRMEYRALRDGNRKAMSELRGPDGMQRTEAEVRGQGSEARGQRPEDGEETLAARRPARRPARRIRSRMELLGV